MCFSLGRGCFRLRHRQLRSSRKVCGMSAVGRSRGERQADFPHQTKPLLAARRAILFSCRLRMVDRSAIRPWHSVRCAPSQPQCVPLSHHFELSHVSFHVSYSSLFPLVPSSVVRVDSFADASVKNEKGISGSAQCLTLPLAVTFTTSGRASCYVVVVRGTRRAHSAFLSVF